MIFSYILTLFGVCGLAVGSLIVLRTIKSGGGLALGVARPIQVVGRQTLGAGANLMLVEIDGERMLIGVSRAGISLLESKASATNRSPQPVEGRSAPTVLRQAEDCGSSFHTVLKRAGQRW